jgi:hypothetical protein
VSVEDRTNQTRRYRQSDVLVLNDHSRFVVRQLDNRSLYLLLLNDDALPLVHAKATTLVGVRDIHALAHFEPMEMVSLHETPPI